MHFRETELGALSDEEFASHLLAVESMKLEKVREGGRAGRKADTEGGWSVKSALIFLSS